MKTMQRQMLMLGEAIRSSQRRASGFGNTRSLLKTVKMSGGTALSDFNQGSFPLELAPPDEDYRKSHTGLEISQR